MSPEQPSRGFTDRLTNGVHLLDLPYGALAKYVIEGKLPSPFLPSFLHEATHHWCLATDLGAALALVEMRTHRDLQYPAAYRDRLIRDFASLHIARELLQPLLEGMALFQEFDAFPGDSNVISTPATWAARLFRPLGNPGPQPPESERAAWFIGQVRDILIRYRLSPSARLRKIGILMRSPKTDPHGYLTGYLTVKRIWQSAVQQNDAFIDRDLFLCFLRDWIFEDWELIRRLLDPELSPLSRAMLASERLQARLLELGNAEMMEGLAIYDREIGSGNIASSSLLQSLDLDELDVREGQGLLAELHTDMVGDRNGEVPENWVLGDIATIRYRQELVRLASEPVEIEVNEHQRVLVRKLSGASPSDNPLQGVYAAAAAPPEAELGTTPGWMSVHLSLPKLMVVSMAHRDNQAMFSLESSQVPDDTLDLLKFFVTKVVATEEPRRNHSTLGRQMVAAFEDPGYLRLVQEFADHARNVYTKHALSGVPADRHTEVTARLDRGGIYDLVGRDGDLLTALVEISMVPFVDDSWRQMLSQTLLDDGIDLAVSIEKLARHSHANGMPLLQVDAQRVMALV